VSRYTPATDEDRREMLAAIGVDSIEELFADIPAALRLTEPLKLDAGRAEQEVFEELRALAARNVSTEDETSFLGAGMYDHYVPAIIDSIIERSEFLTPYTPYQPEISQGGLQAMFEYQTAISELTGLPVSNASVYEGQARSARLGTWPSWPTAADGSWSPEGSIPTRARSCARRPTRGGPRS
jgi:glycine dehydrogenase subunit 1